MSKRNGRTAETASVPPQNLDAEQAVLGAILLAGANGLESSQRAIEDIRETGLERRDFYYKESHGRVFEACLSLVERGEPTDIISVDAVLRRRNEFEAAAKLPELASASQAFANAAHHASLVFEAAQKRRQLYVLSAAAEAVQNGGLEAKPELLDRLAEILNPPARTPALEPLWLRDALERKLPESREYVTDVLQIGVLAEIAGLPYSYKSALALELAHKVGAGKGELLGRFPIQASANVAYFWGDDSEASELGRLQGYAKRHDFALEPVPPIAFYLNPPLVLPEGLPLLSAEVERHGFGLVVLDSVYNFAPGLNWSDNAEVTRLYGALKRLCDERRGLSIVLVDHAPKPSESTRGRHASISSFGSVYKAASVRCSIALEREGEKLWISATGNNVRGFTRSLAVFDEEELELRLVDAEVRDYRAEVLAHLSERGEGLTQSEVAAGIGCRLENAKEALEAAEAAGEAHRERVKRTDAGGRRRKVDAWLPGPARHDFPTPGKLWEVEPNAAGHEDTTTAAPLSPVGAGGRADGESGQGVAGDGST